jgi:hypothetical protein
MTDGPAESFAAFKNSFSYGSRTDLSFKFLKKLSEAEAAEFISELFRLVGSSLDDGEIGSIHQLVYEWQVRAYAPDPAVPPTWAYADAPFAEMPKPLSQSRVALVTSTGHFLDGDDPNPMGIEGLTQEASLHLIDEFQRVTPELSMLDRDFEPRSLRVRHPGYDIRGVERDPNVGFPRDLMLAAEAEGRIGELAPRLFSFTGVTSQKRLQVHAIPGWIEELRRDGVDAVLLVPI